MITPEYMEGMVKTLRFYDPKLTEEEADLIAAEIGDTPVILDGMVQATLHGQPYDVPAEVLFADE